jgi:hypothetical protein
VEACVDKRLWERTLARERAERRKVKAFYEGVARHRGAVQELLNTLEGS